MMTDKRVSSEPYPPSEYICDAICERDWTIRQFAEQAKIEIELAIGLLTGQLRIGMGLAIPLARAFGTSSELWLNLQSSYDRALGVKAARYRSRGK